MKTSEPIEIRRGDILWIRCDPSIDAEPRKLRTCVVVSNDVANQFGQAVTVVPTQAYPLRGPRERTLSTFASRGQTSRQRGWRTRR